MKDQSDLQLVPAESDLYKDIIGYLSGRAGFDIKRYVERIEINKQREIYVDGNRIAEMMFIEIRDQDNWSSHFNVHGQKVRGR